MPYVTVAPITDASPVEELVIVGGTVGVVRLNRPVLGAVGSGGPIVAGTGAGATLWAGVVPCRTRPLGCCTHSITRWRLWPTQQNY